MTELFRGHRRYTEAHVNYREWLPSHPNPKISSQLLYFIDRGDLDWIFVSCIILDRPLPKPKFYSSLNYQDGGTDHQRLSFL